MNPFFGCLYVEYKYRLWENDGLRYMFPAVFLAPKDSDSVTLLVWKAETSGNGIRAGVPVIQEITDINVSGGKIRPGKLGTAASA